MLSALRLQASNPKINRKINLNSAGNLNLSPPAEVLRLPPRRFTVLSFQSSENVTALKPETCQFTSSVGNPSLKLSQWTLTQRHITVLNVVACAVAISATWLFCSAIPTLLSFKRAAESLEKLMDVTREELPDTMAAVRLSGMEISDLTMELSDLGQEITQGVRSSTRAVRVAEERLRHFANMSSTASIQEVPNRKTTTAEPVVARTARGIREGIVKGRGLLQMFFVLTRFSRLLFNYFPNRSKQRTLKN